LANFKLTISDSKGKSITKELKDAEANPLISLQLGSETDAAIVGLSGKLKITGGSDKSGVPMRADIHGASRKYVLLTKGVGLQDAEKGERVRKLTRGNAISEEIYQVNCRFDGQLPNETTKTEKTDSPKDEKEPKKAKTDSPKDEKEPKKAKTDSPKDEKEPKKAKTDSPKDEKEPKKE